MKKIILLVMLFLCTPVFAQDITTNESKSAVPTQDVTELDDGGTYEVDSLIIKSLGVKGSIGDIKQKISGLNNSVQNDIGQLKKGFSDNFDKDGNLVKGFVPLEAKIARIFISVLSDLSKAIYVKLMPFLNVFIIMILAFWFFGESWQMMSNDKDYWKLVIRITKKVVLISVWLWVLNNNPANLFMRFIDPLIVVGTVTSDLVLNGVLDRLNTHLPDTCNAIHAWIENGTDGLIANNTIANLLCLPTRVTTFFYTAINAGFNLMLQGIKTFKPIIFFIGLTFVILFLVNTWRFIITTLGVIVDLFFVLMFLPFTMVKECFKPEDTTYKGMFFPIWDQLLDLVGGKTLAEQIRKFVGVVIYFIVLSIMSAISLIMIAGFNPTLDNAITLIIVGFLVFYLMSKEQIDKVAKILSGEIDTEFGDKFNEASKKYAGNLWKLIKSKAKGLAAKKGGGDTAATAAE